MPATETFALGTTDITHLLSRIHHNPIQIRPFNINPIIQPPHFNSITPIPQPHLQRRTHNDPLVRIPLIQSLHIFHLSIDNY